MEKEQELYDVFVQGLIDKVKSGKAETSDYKLIKDFIHEKNIGANSQTHPGMGELTAMPFPDEDVEDNVTPIRIKK